MSDDEDLPLRNLSKNAMTKKGKSSSIGKQNQDLEYTWDYTSLYKYLISIPVSSP